ncbi:hypothetical protein EON67_09285 [archaeon]|nr:MAG: hypothetical protein EON67_09285 [archaeon]
MTPAVLAAKLAASPVRLLAGGVPDTSKFTLPLYKNLVASSFKNLLIGFDPLACYLFTLQARYGHGATFLARTADASATVHVEFKPGSLVPALPSTADADAATAWAFSAHARAVAALSEMATVGAGFAKMARLLPAQ